VSLEQKSQVLASIKFLTGSLTNRTFSISKFITTLGRDSDNDIVIPDRRVSRLHARLVYDNEQWKIENLSESSYVTLDKQSIGQAVLNEDSIIGLGDTVSFLFSTASIVGEMEGETLFISPQQPSQEVAVDTSSTEAVTEEATVLVNIQREPAQAMEALEISPHNTPEPLIKQPEQAVKALEALESSSDSSPRPMATQVASFSAMGLATLEVTDNTTGARKLYPLMQQRLNIGRDPKNDIVIDEPSISDLHMQIIHEKNQWILMHPHPDQPETENGLIYQGLSIRGDESFRRQLTRGDVFRIGDEYGSLITLTYYDGSNQREAPPRVQPIRLGASEITIGRLEDNSVVLDHPQVSAHHAQLVKEQESYRLTDLDSTNYTYVNGLKATTQLLQINDEIRIGPFLFIYTDGELTQFDESKGVRIDALNLKRVGTNQTVLLNDISVSIPARSFVALVGGSGAGKTTLMSALSGLRPAQEGSVFYNGQDYYRNLNAFSTQLGYVPQDDIIHRELTVERALYYAAKLRLPRDFQDAQIEHRINEVLADVEMEHRRKLLINQLSGGQRKRVSIALELLAKPSVFFLDEPTSGLDPGLDRKMMLLLRKLADKGHTVLLVTHATNNINVCDYVCFLAQGGNLAYFGPPEEAKSYFKQPDFAEIYSLLEPSDDARSIPLQAKEKFEDSQPYQAYISDPLGQRPKMGTQALREQQQQTKSRRKDAPLRQFFLLVQRYLELLRNDLRNLAVLLLQAPVFGLLLLLFIKGVGTDAFNPNTVLQCPTTAAIVAARGYPDVSTPDNPVVSHSCQRVENFLKNDPRGKAYASARGGSAEALQDFLISGPSNPSTVLFLVIFAAIMFGCVNSIREIVKEAPIYKRERTVNLGILPYMFSKIAVLGFLCLVQSLILVGFVAILDPFPHGIFLQPFLEVYITVTLTSIAGLVLGLMISAISPNSDLAMSFLPLLLLPQVVFSGAIFPLTSWYLQYPGMLFPARWGMAGLSSSVGLHSDKINGDKLFGDNYSYRGTLFSVYNQAEATRYLLIIWLILIVMIALYIIGTGYFLKRKDKQA
jgi:ABC transport system ATP-binding/permease protein